MTNYDCGDKEDGEQKRMVKMRVLSQGLKSCSAQELIARQFARIQNLKF